MRCRSVHLPGFPRRLDAAISRSASLIEDARFLSSRIAMWSNVAPAEFARVVVMDDPGG